MGPQTARARSMAALHHHGRPKAQFKLRHFDWKLGIVGSAKFEFCNLELGSSFLT